MRNYKRKRNKTFPAFRRCWFTWSRLNRLPAHASASVMAKALNITRSQLTKWMHKGLPVYATDDGPKSLVYRDDLIAFLISTGRAKAKG